jgi:two-component system, NarL family, nitrate/nitrite response regulator NarL
VRVSLPVHSALTPREAQVLQRLIEGSTTREIAESYGIGHQTVKNYVTVIYEKLGVQGRRQLFEVSLAGGHSGSSHQADA